MAAANIRLSKGGRREGKRKKERKRRCYVLPSVGSSLGAGGRGVEDCKQLPRPLFQKGTFVETMVKAFPQFPH